MSYSQNIQVPQIVLTNIEFEIKISDYPDANSSIPIKIISSEGKLISEHHLNRQEKQFSGKIKLLIVESILLN